MPAAGDPDREPRRTRRRAPLHAAPEPTIDPSIDGDPELLAAIDEAFEAPAGARRGERRPTLLVLGLVLAVTAAVFVAASNDRDSTDAGSDVFAFRPVDVTARTETSAPRVETAAATDAAPAGAPLDDAPIVPGGDLDAIIGADGVPSTGGYTDLIRSYFGSLTVEAIVIVQCESGFDPNAVGTNTNGTQDHGLFQINDVHMKTFEAVIGHPWTSIYEPQLNVAFAAWLHDHAGGWGPWRCNRNLEAFQAEAGD